MTFRGVTDEKFHLKYLFFKYSFIIHHAISKHTADTYTMAYK